jgi:Mn-dependent DtxR family transcriptional regulator
MDQKYTDGVSSMNRELTDSEKNTLEVMAKFSSDDDLVCPTASKVEKEIGLSRRLISILVKSLTKKGYLSKVASENSSDTYRINVGSKL